MRTTAAIVLTLLASTGLACGDDSDSVSLSPAERQQARTVADETLAGAPKAVRDAFERCLLRAIPKRIRDLSGEQAEAFGYRVGQRCTRQPRVAAWLAQYVRRETLRLFPKAAPRQARTCVAGYLDDFGTDDVQTLVKAAGRVKVQEQFRALMLRACGLELFGEQNARKRAAATLVAVLRKQSAPPRLLACVRRTIARLPRRELALVIEALYAPAAASPAAKQLPGQIGGACATTP